MKVQFKMRVSELEFMITHQAGKNLTYVLDFYFNGCVCSHVGNQKRLKKIYPGLLSLK